MTEQEISELCLQPFSKIAELCGAVTDKQKDALVTVMNLCISMGIKLAQERVHRYYNEMFRDYKEVSIKN